VLAKVEVPCRFDVSVTVTYLTSDNMTHHDDHSPATRMEKKRQGKTGGTPFSAKHVRAAAALRDIERPVLVPAAEVKKAAKKRR